MVSTGENLTNIMWHNMLKTPKSLNSLDLELAKVPR